MLDKILILKLSFERLFFVIDPAQFNTLQQEGKKDRNSLNVGVNLF